jgi:hypothetical protein
MDDARSKWAEEMGCFSHHWIWNPVSVSKHMDRTTHTLNVKTFLKT